jgi:Lon protease-like protein
VLFPGGRLPLRVFEQRYLGMAKACLRDGTPFGVCLIAEGREVGDPAVPAEVGCTARIAEWDMPQLGVLQLVARGEQRFRIRTRHVEADGLVRGTVEPLEERDAPVPPGHGASVALLQRIVGEHPALFERPHDLGSAAWVSGRLAEVLPLPLDVKQQLLEMDDPVERLGRINGMLSGALSGAS